MGGWTKIVCGTTTREMFRNEGSAAARKAAAPANAAGVGSWSRRVGVVVGVIVVVVVVVVPLPVASQDHPVLLPELVMLLPDVTMAVALMLRESFTSRNSIVLVP